MTGPESGEARPRSAFRAQAPVVAAVAAGGGAGATARYAATLVWPTPAGGFPWTILWVNAVGCALMGVLIVAVTEWRTTHPLLRPFLGTGVLGGFTTFSTYAVDVRGLFEDGRPAPALLYLALTPVTALAAVWAATAAARRALLERPAGGGAR